MEFRTLDVPTEDGHTLKLGAYHGNADVSILWEDPLRTRMVTSRFLFEVFRMQRFVRRNITRLRSPLLGLLAGEDTLVDNGATLEILRHVEGTPVRIENYREAHHVLTGSLPLEELVGRIWHWFTAPEASLERTVVIEEIQDLPSPNGASAMN